MTTLYLDSNYPYSSSYACKCENCGWRGNNSYLEPIRDAEQRLAPGEEVPAGECPECQALAYVVNPANQQTDRSTDRPTARSELLYNLECRHCGEKFLEGEGWSDNTCLDCSPEGSAMK